MEILARYNAITQNIAHMRGKSLFKQAVELIAVSKGHPPEHIIPLLEAGQRIFGENRVQEAASKWTALRASHDAIALHLIGPLQTNKAKEALAIFNVIETIDRPALVDAITRERAKHDLRCQHFYIQVNTGEEPQKSGIFPGELPQLFAYTQVKQLPVTGLMCVPPAHANPAPHFALLHAMAQELGLPRLSMGMSDDYETAIRLGATHIRIGTALFGQRGKGEGVIPSA